MASKGPRTPLVVKQTPKITPSTRSKVAKGLQRAGGDQPSWPSLSQLPQDGRSRARRNWILPPPEAFLRAAEPSRQWPKADCNGQVFSSLAKAPFRDHQLGGGGLPATIKGEATARSNQLWPNFG